MSGRKATLQHLQVLQSSHPLEVPPACLGPIGLAQFSPCELFHSETADDDACLRDTLRTAEFWIGLLEGEHCDLVEEVGKHRQRHQLALRQAEAKASALREADGERKRLQAQLKGLQQSHDQAIRERHVLQEDSRSVSRSGEDEGALAARAEALEQELRREREEKAALEAQLVRTKVRYAETLQKVDGMQYLIECYVDQLRALSPTFEPVDLMTVGQLRPSPSWEADSNASGETKQPSVASEEKPHKKSQRGSFKAGFPKKIMRHMFTRREGKDNSEQPSSMALDSPSVGSSSPWVQAVEHPAVADAGGGVAASDEEPNTGVSATAGAELASVGGSSPAPEATAVTTAPAAALEEATPVTRAGRPKRWEMRRE